MSVTAVIVARGGSVRLPGKALLPFAGTTLLAHKVRTLLACPSVTSVVVGSDSGDILAEAVRAGAVAVQRDAYHCDERQCSANEMLRDMAGKVSGETILWAHPTNPLVRSETYEAALAAYRDGLAAGFDSLFSVTRIQRHAWAGGLPVNHQPWGVRHQTAAQLAPIDFQDGAIFIQPRERMRENAYFYGRRPLPFVVDAVEGWDIDVMADYRAALALWAICGRRSSVSGQG